MTKTESLELFEADQRLLAPGIQSIATRSKLVLDHGRGATITDINGKRYIDFVAGVGVASIGHAHPHYVKRVSEQVARINVGSQTTESRVRFLEQLAPLLPGDLARVQLYSSGAEAVEAAIRLAKSHTKKWELVSFSGGFHGKTNLTMSLTSGDLRYGYGPFVPGVHILPYGDCHRCPVRLSYPQCDMACLEIGREQLKRQSADAIAAFIIEPIQGTAGNVVPPAEFVRGVWDLAREFDALVIADEMITGFGRTGRMFGCEHWDMVPDIMCLGKGLASGFPMSAIATTDAISQAEPFAKPSGSSSSYGGNPLAAAAARATLEVIVEENLVENSRVLGAKLISRLEEMSGRYPFLTHIRGRGLMVGADLLEPDTGKPLGAEPMARLFRAAIDRGLLGFVYSPRLRLNPPLVIDEDLLNEGLDILDQAFETMAASL